MPVFASSASTKPRVGYSAPEPGLFQVETGFGVHFGGSSGPAGEFIFAPGATFIELPGKFKQDPINTLGLGFGWRV